MSNSEISFDFSALPMSNSSLISDEPRLLYLNAKSLHKELYERIFDSNVIYNPGYRSNEELRYLLSLYKEYMLSKTENNNDNDSMEVLIRDIVYLCYVWQIEDSETVIQCLRYLYDAVGHFTFIYELFRPTRLTVPWPIETVKTISPVEYFANHASRVKELFEGVPFVDVNIVTENSIQYPPLTLSLGFCIPSLTKCLLLHGACITHPTKGITHLAVSVIGLILRFLEVQIYKNRHVDGFNINDIFQKASTVRSENEYFQCANLILQYLPPLKVRDYLIRRFETYTVIDEPLLQFINNLFEEKFLPRLGKVLKELPSLKHLCRIVLLERLRNNRELPFGIDTLAYPVKLKRYLKFADDLED